MNKFHIIFKDKYEDDDWIISRIKFSEDEFRLTEQLTHNRIYNRLDSLETDVLLDCYYNIKLNYFDIS